MAALYDAHVGGAWHAAGTTWRMTGIVQNPSNLADEFALAAPGQVPHPSQVIMLLGPAAAQRGRPHPVDHPAVAASVDRRVVVSPGQARSLLAAVRGLSDRGQHLEAFYACLYYAALRPSEAVMLRETARHLPKNG